MQSFASTVGRYAGSEVLFEPTNAPARVTWYGHAIYNRTEPTRRKPFDQNLIFQHIEAQTGLTASKQFRTVRRLFVEAV